MNAKQWLGRARFVDREINALEKAKQETWDALTRITQNYDTDGAQTSKDPHKYDRIAELENLIDQKIDNLYSMKAEILQTISDLDDARQRTVLISYYISMKTLEQIAVEQNYSFRQISRIRLQGIREISRLFGDKMS